MDLMHHLAQVWVIGACAATVQSGVVILDVITAHRIQKKMIFVLCKLINLELCIFYRWCWCWICDTFFSTRSWFSYIVWHHSLLGSLSQHWFSWMLQINGSQLILECCHLHIWRMNHSRLFFFYWLTLALLLDWFSVLFFFFTFPPENNLKRDNCNWAAKKLHISST